MNYEIIGNLLAGILILMVYSYLYKETPVFRLGEHIFIGLTIAVSLVMVLDAIKKIAILPILNGDLLLIIPLGLGCLVFFAFSKEYYYIYRVPLAIIIGVGTGLSIVGQTHGSLITQVIATILPITTPDIATNLNNILILIGTITVASYFIFTVKQSGPLKYSARLGRYMLMVAFGSSFGATVMTRVAPAFSQVSFLLTTEAIYTIPIVIAALAITSYMDRTKKSAKL